MGKTTMTLLAPVRPLLLFTAFLLVALPARSYAACDGIPWKFGMTPAEVQAIADCGPYRAFSNGDLETYEAVFDGKKRNIEIKSSTVENRASVNWRLER
jgi:hypothetical protein